jgi:hypothetical protein
VTSRDQEERELLRLAALSGPFEAPAILARIAGQPASERDWLRLAELGSALAARAETDSDRWVLRTRERQWLLAEMKTSGRLDDAIRARRAENPDEDTRALLDALEGKGAFHPKEVMGAIWSAGPDPAARRAALTAMAAALDRAGRLAKAADAIHAVRSELALLDRSERQEGMVGQFVGRGTLVADLVGALAAQAGRKPVSVIYVSGLPGSGKSALLERVVAERDELDRDFVVRLDFDRAGLDVLDQPRLTMEVARQIADQLGEESAALFRDRVLAATVSPGSESAMGTLQQRFPTEFAAKIGSRIAGSGRGVLVLLDTLEVLRGRGSQHPVALLDWLDSLAEAGVAPLRVIAAGRGDAMDTVASRIGLHRRIDVLSEADATALMERLAVPPDRHAEVRALSGDRPLLIRIAADALAADPDLYEHALARAVADAFLTRFLTSRIEDPSLAAIARLAIVPPRLNAALLETVLAPLADSGPVDAADAARLFGLLETLPWLMSRDPEAGWLVPLADSRAVLLSLVRQREPDRLRALHVAAAAWFDAHGLGDEARWHEAQARDIPVRRMAAREAPPEAAAPEPAEPVAAPSEPAAAPALNAAPAASPDAVDQFLGFIDREDWLQGEHAAHGAEAEARARPEGPLAAAVAALWWRAGRWAKALDLMRLRLAATPADGALPGLPLSLQAAFLEMWGEFEPEALRRALTIEALAEASRRPRQDPIQLARRGCYGFRLAVWNSGAGRPLGTGADPVGAALSLAGARSDEGAVGQAFRLAREQLATRGGGRVKGWNDRQLLASLSPYPLFAMRLALQRDRRWIEEAARGVEPALLSMGAFFDPPVEGMAAMADNAIGGIAGAGLFAEWAEATAFLRGDPDLAAIAAAAARWRRAVAGDWTLGEPPESWRQETPDLTIAGRTRVLARGADRLASAAAQLAAWAPAGTDIRAAIAGRFPDTQATDSRPVERAAQMLDAGMPAAFVPPLAILTADPKRS